MPDAGVGRTIENPIAKIEESQRVLRKSIEEMKRLSDEADRMLHEHRDGCLAPTPREAAPEQPCG